MFSNFFKNIKEIFSKKYSFRVINNFCSKKLTLLSQFVNNKLTFQVFFNLYNTLDIAANKHQNRLSKFLSDCHYVGQKLSDLHFTPKNNPEQQVDFLKPYLRTLFESMIVNVNLHMLALTKAA